MRKRLMVVSVIIMLMAGFGLQLAYADENPERHPISMPAHLAPVYGFAGIERDVDHEAADKAAPMQMPLGYIPTSSPGSQIATTTYDYQHNCSMGRMIEHRGSQYISMVWMYKETSVLGGDRDVILQTYDMDEYFCDLKVDIPVNTGRAGYCALDVDPASGYAIPTAHEGLAIYAAASYFNGGFPHTYGGPFNAHYPTDNFGWWLNPGTGPFNENLWPKIEWQVGSQTFLHLVACEAGTPPEDGQTISYYRKQFDDYNDDGGNVWSDQHLIDTVKSLNVTLAASQISNRVAIVWAGPCEYKKDTPNEFNSQYT
ncbi:MAG: hypothetical protein GY841_03185, partial [FCB group bacterium]|nr:hypothetical protein [FCB group bacterium]